MSFVYCNKCRDTSRLCDGTDDVRNSGSGNGSPSAGMYESWIEPTELDYFVNSEASTPETPGSPNRKCSEMFSPRRRKKKPLGYYVPESKIELHVEKAMFRRNSEILREMCARSMKHRPDEGQMPPNTPLPAGNITPEMRWLLTRSARLQRVNNAEYSKYNHRVSERVGSAGGRRVAHFQSLQRQRSMCKRTDEVDPLNMRKLQCDILGPTFCTDCTEVRKKSNLLMEQRKNFPRLEIHQRSLVAPDKVQKMYLSHPDQLFHQATKRSYQCGCEVDPELEITTPLVYTPHEVFERIRQKHRQHGNNVFGKGKIKETVRETTRPLFYDEKTDPPLDLKVSVTFRST